MINLISVLGQILGALLEFVMVAAALLIVASVVVVVVEAVREFVAPASALVEARTEITSLQEETKVRLGRIAELEEENARLRRAINENPGIGLIVLPEGFFDNPPTTDHQG